MFPLVFYKVVYILSTNHIDEVRTFMKLLLDINKNKTSAITTKHVNVQYNVIGIGKRMFSFIMLNIKCPKATCIELF